jgi:hypothetical protein
LFVRGIKGYGIAGSEMGKRSFSMEPELRSREEGRKRIKRAQGFPEEFQTCSPGFQCVYLTFTDSTFTDSTFTDITN